MYEGGTNAYNNWIELAVGGFAVNGNQAQFQQSLQSLTGPLGGISDFHYQADLNKTTTATVDGHALFDLNDYQLKLGVTREKLGYLRFGYTEFRTWYNGDGGFYPPTDAWYPLSPNPLALDRGTIFFEGGLQVENVPNITFRYSHDFREGDKSSTIWGYTHPAGGTVVRGLSPTFYSVDEKSDSFALDVTHHIKATDFGAGLRYDMGTMNDALKITQFPGESIQQKVTDKQGTSYDMLNVHAFTETWLKKNLMFSSGFSYSDLDNDLTGSRIYGAAFDVPYAPNAQSGFGYYGLSGNSRLHEYVLNLNLLSTPAKYFTIVPSLRARKQDANADFTAVETLGAYAPTPFSGNSDRNQLDMSESLLLSWTRITNWVFNATGEWMEEQGDLNENGGLGPVNGFGVPPIQRQTDDNTFNQKYGLEARWYPLRRVTVDLAGYYKRGQYDYNSSVDSTPNDPSSVNRYPAYLVMQNFQTYDGNGRLTLRPIRNITLFTRYDYQYSTIDTQPAAVSQLPEEQTAQVTSQVIAQNVSWTPLNRLTLQAQLNYVLSETKTPVTDYTQAVQNSQNNYWIVDFFTGVVLDNKTDLNLNYYYYRANDYVDNSLEGVPYGPGATNQGITATLVRRLTQNLRLTLKYGYYHYVDQPSGGNDNFNAQFVYSSLQCRF
jgi:hypothetical protein